MVSFVISQLFYLLKKVEILISLLIFYIINTFVWNNHKTAVNGFIFYFDYEIGEIREKNVLVTSTKLA